MEITSDIIDLSWPLDVFEGYFKFLINFAVKNGVNSYSQMQGQYEHNLKLK